MPPTARLLLVDPDPRSSELLTKHLQVHGFAISAVASTDAAQQQLETQLIDGGFEAWSCGFVPKGVSLD